MYKGAKKIKFSSGNDANQMLMRKLVCNFFSAGKITTTISKARVLKSYIEKLTEKIKEENNANKNYLISKLNNEKLIDSLYREVAPIIKNRVGGYVRIIKLGRRDSDGVDLGKIEWIQPIVIKTNIPKINKNSKEIAEKK